MKITYHEGRVIDRYWVEDNYHGEEELILPKGYIAISNEAFVNNSSIKKVIVPEGIIQIGESAFQNCSNLREVVMADSVIAIEEWAFAGCGNLESIRLSERLCEVEKYCFDECRKLKEVYIPDSVAIIGEYAFSSCSSLEKVRLSENLSALSAGLFNRCISLQDVNIPDSIFRINSYAFKGCQSLKSIDMSNVEILGTNVFESCKSLYNVKMEKMQDLRPSIFYDCVNLESICLPDSVKSIPHDLFHGCSKLKDVRLPKSLKEIADTAFSGTSLGTSLPYIRKDNEIIYVSDDTRHINDMIFPEGITKITRDVLTRRYFETIQFPESLENYEGGAYAKKIIIDCNPDIFVEKAFVKEQKLVFKAEKTFPFRIVLQKDWKCGNADKKFIEFINNPTFENFQAISNPKYKLPIAIAYGMSEKENYLEYQKTVRKLSGEALRLMIEDRDFIAIDYYAGMKILTSNAIDKGIELAIQEDDKEMIATLIKHKGDNNGYKKNITKQFEL